jgi:prepilin-type N-terminal cleavage/methylation domain-containing protein
MRSALRRQAGFSLVELMAVVVIMGILAVTGITYFRKHALASKVTEAQAMIQSIRAAEERYRAENRQYLSIIPAAAPLPGCGNKNGLYPAPPDGARRSFYLEESATANYNSLWWLLRPTTSGPVQFGYAVKAGSASTTTRIPLPPDIASLPTAPIMPLPTDSWYVIEAIADNDNDGVCCVVAGTSLNGEVYVQNEGE